VNVKVAVLCGLCSAASAGAALWLAPARAVPEKVSKAPVGERPIERSGGSPTGANLAAVGHVVRAEIEAALGRQASAEEARRRAAPGSVSAESPVGAGDVPEPSPPVDESAATSDYRESKQRVDDSIRRGVWTEDDRQSVSGALARMNPAERRQIIGEVIRAVNRGALRVEADNLFM
jgi:hypothetical protein